MDEPREPAAEAPELLNDEPENPAAPAAKGRLAVRPPAKKRGAGSVDELLQQLEVLDQEVSRARAEIEQINRRIGDLERRRQVLGDQLALTLRSRVPSEILRLAAGDGAAGKPADAGRAAEAAG